MQGLWYGRRRRFQHDRVLGDLGLAQRAGQPQGDLLGVLGALDEIGPDPPAIQAQGREEQLAARWRST